MPKLNLGCGRDYREGWDNWDVSQEVKADRYIDIATEEWLVPDGYYEEIYCSGVLEQILENEKLLYVMNRSHWVLKPFGLFTIIVPNAKYSNAFKDPFDCRQFTEPTFKYFDLDQREYKLYGSVYGFKPWHVTSIETNPSGIITAVLQKR